MAASQISGWFLDPDDSDLQVHIETDKRGLNFPAHGLILKRASNVFKIMLDEKNNYKEGQTKVVQLQLHGDVSDALCFMRYLYSKNLPRRELASYLEIMQSAHLYEVRDLLEGCEGIIEKLISPYSVCKIYITVGNIATEVFLKHCYDMMLKTAFLIFSNNFHLELKEQTMEFLLKSDGLNVVDEEQSLNALWEWGSYKSFLENQSTKEEDIKKTISNLLPFVRWSLIKDVPKTRTLMKLYKENVTDEASCVRKASSELSLNKFANVKSVLRQAIGVNESYPLQIYIKTILIRIVPTQGIYFSGFDIIFIDEYPESSTLPFFVLFNGKEVTDLITWKKIMVSACPFKIKFSNVKVSIECTAPLHISPGDVFCIAIRMIGREIFMPSYNLLSMVPEQETTDIIFASENVIGITDLFYFPETIV